MARLSKKQTVRVSFLAHKLALTYGQQERETLLKDLLDALGIDDEQAQQSRESAESHIRYMAGRKRKSEQQAKPAADPIDEMSLDELRAHNAQLLARRDELLARRRLDAMSPDEMRRHIDTMSDEERRRYQEYLVASIAGKLDPAPTVTEADTYNLPTKRMEQAIARLDDMTDSDQVDQLRQMWGE